MEDKKFIEFLEGEISRLFLFEGDGNALSNKKQGEIMQYLKGVASGGGPEAEKMLRNAKENGFNTDTVTGDLDSDEYKANMSKMANGTPKAMSTKQKELNSWVKEYLPILRSCYKGKIFLAKDRTDNNGSGSVFDLLSNEQKANVLLLRNFLDKESLTFLYREADKPKVLKILYNVDVDSVDHTTPVEKINLDFSKISEEEAREYYTGTRLAWINELIKKMGLEPHRPLTDTGAITKKDEVWKEGALDIVKAEKAKSVVEKYLSNVYGMDFNLDKGSDLFSYGNSKVPEDTLIVNFSSALMCPAWNECLLKDVCYARNTEKHYFNTFKRNQRSNVIWMQTQTDTKLMSMMLELVRCYIVNYNKLAQKIKKLNSTLFESICNEVSSDSTLPDTLSKMSFSEIRQKYGDEIIEYIKSTKYSACKNIRLNEDGDFIGQWLVDAWDEWAGDFKIIDVTVTAYTCRALNYEKIKNLILNVSKDRLVSTNETGAVAHYFCAVTPDTYNSFKETYGGREDFGLDLTLNGGIIKPVYRALKDEQGKTAAYYYKCPCGRGKYTYVESEEKMSKKVQTISELELNNPSEDSPKLATVDGTKVYKRVDNKVKGKYVDCYRCRICYGRSAEEGISTDDNQPIDNTLPVYVFVAAHGASKELFKDQTKIKGRPVTDWLKLQNQEQITPEPATVGATLNESMETDEVIDPLAIKIITKNAIDSVANMMRQKISSINEQFKKYDDILKKLE